MLNQLKPALILTILLTLLTGLLYPLAVTGVARILFPHRAGGSLVEKDGTIVGSELIGQRFSRPGYFHPRPSAAGAGYDAAASSGSNLGPLSGTLIERVDSLRRSLERTNPGTPVPVELVTASGSGLDPHLSPAGAEFQIPRVARERGMPEERVRELVRAHIEGRQFGLLGEPRVNVLALNMALDRLSPVP